jgi:hypothetical protein
VKGINPTGLPEVSTPERLVGVDLEVEYFKGIDEHSPTVDRDDYVIPEDGYFSSQTLDVLFSRPEAAARKSRRHSDT